MALSSHGEMPTGAPLADSSSKIVVVRVPDVTGPVALQRHPPSLALC